MGYDVRVGVIVGMEVSVDELFIEEKQGYRCQRGHEYKRSPPPFCSQDGTPVKEVVVRKPDPKFDMGDLTDPDELTEDCELDGLRFFNADPIQSCESRSRILVLGEEVFHASVPGSSRTKSAQPVDLATIEALKAKIETVAKAHHLPERPVRIYPYVYESY